MVSLFQKTLAAMGVALDAPAVSAEDVFERMKPRSTGLRLFDAHALLYHALKDVKPAQGSRICQLWDGENEWFAGRVADVAEDGALWVEWEDGSSPEWVSDSSWLYVSNLNNN